MNQLLKHCRQSPSYHVPEGMMKVTGGPASITANVIFGYVVTTTFVGCSYGGLLHLPFRLVSSEDGIKRIKAVVDDYINALNRVSHGRKDGIAEIIGGADPLGLYPRSRLDGRAHFIKEIIQEVLVEHGIKVYKTRVGGYHGLAVMLDLSNGSVEVRVSSENCPATVCTVGRAKANGLSDQPRVVAVNMGCMHVDHSPTQMTAILGSCVGIALYDPLTKIGGLAHAMMPCYPNGKQGALDQAENRARFADSAVGALVEGMVRAGAHKHHIQAKVTGGAKVLNTGRDADSDHIAGKNIRNALAAIDEQGITLISKDVGGLIGRKLLLDLDGFIMRVRMLSTRTCNFSTTPPPPTGLRSKG